MTRQVQYATSSCFYSYYYHDQGRHPVEPIIIVQRPTMDQPGGGQGYPPPGSGQGYPPGGQNYPSGPQGKSFLKKNKYQCLAATRIYNLKRLKVLRQQMPEIYNS